MIRVNSKTMAKLKPCQDRFDNWKEQYGNKSFTLHQFLSLDKITAKDKIWVAVRIIPRELVEVFAIDCALKAADAADATAADATAASAAYAAAVAEAAYAAADATAASAADYAADAAYAAAVAEAAYAAAYADAFAAYAANHAAYAANAADYAAVSDNSLEDSVDALIYLTKGL